MYRACDCCIERRPPSLSHLTGSGRVLPPTWTRKIRKAGEEETPEHRWLLAIAERLEADAKDAFLQAVEKMRGTIREEEIAQALETGSVERVLQALDIEGQFGPDLAAKLSKPLEDVFIEAGRETPARTLQAVGGMGMRFDLTNPAAIDFLESYNMGLIRQVTDETRNAVRAVVLNAFREGGHPYVQARTIRDLVGLTQRQAQSVLNFRRGLLETAGKPITPSTILTPETMARPGAGLQGLNLPTGRGALDRIERSTARQAQKVLNQRAKNIARTETLRAANTGQDAAWAQAREAGLLSKNAREGWVVTPDDRLCIYCAAVPVLNPEGVPLGGEFKTPLGPTRSGPLHPQCRCTKVLIAY